MHMFQGGCYRFIFSAHHCPDLRFNITEIFLKIKTQLQSLPAIGRITTDDHCFVAHRDRSMISSTFQGLQLFRLNSCRFLWLLDPCSFVQASKLGPFGPFLIIEFSNNVESVKTADNECRVTCRCCWVMRNPTKISWPELECWWHLSPTSRCHHNVITMSSQCHHNVITMWSGCQILLWCERIIGSIGPLQCRHVQQLREVFKWLFNR